MKTYEEFRQALQDESFQQELCSRLAERKPETGEAVILATVEFAAEKGYTVTPEELSVEAAKHRELSDEDAQSVAGGAWCWNEYSCFAAWYHDCCDAIMDECDDLTVHHSD